MEDDEPTKEEVATKPLPRKRERKTTAAFTYAVKEKAAFVVQDGKGIAIGALPDLEKGLAKLKGDDILLTTLHRLFFKRSGKKTTIRRNIRHFSGFPGDDAAVEAAVKNATTKIGKLSMPIVKRMIDLFLIDRSPASFEDGLNKAALVERLVEWLSAPKESTIPKKATPKRKAKGGTKRKKKKQKKAKVPRPKSSYMFFCAEHRPSVVEKNPEMKFTEIAKALGAKWRELDDDDKAPFVEQAKADKERFAGKGSKAKKPAKKKAKKKTKARSKKVESDSEEESDDSDDDSMNFAQLELKTKLIKMLKNPKMDKKEMTISKLKKSLEKETGDDLSDQKAFIRTVVKEFYGV